MEVTIKNITGTSTFPDVVYHYTSMEVLLSIVKHKQLWATSIRYLNDVRERDLYLEAVRQRLPKFLPDPEGVLNDLAESSNFSDLPFIVSFSTAQDSLPQWRSYCPNGNGVAIGLRPEGLRKVSFRDPPSLKVGGLKLPLIPIVRFLKVEYFLPEENWRIDGMIEASLQEADMLMATDDPHEPLYGSHHLLLSSLLDVQASSSKHSGFVHEQEYRLMVTSTGLRNNMISYRPSRSTLIPFMQADLSVDQDKTLLTANGESFIHSVMIGPTPDKALTVSALQEMFRGKSMNVQVSASTIPYRDWL